MKNPNKQGKTRHIFKYWSILLRHQLKRLFSLRTEPHQIAMGFAVGAFVGVFPTFGLGFVIISLFGIFLRFNLPAAFIGTMVGNPVVTPFWMFVSYKTGSFIMGLFPKTTPVLIDPSWIKKIFNFGLDYIVGNTLLSFLTGVIGYFLVLRGVQFYLERKAARRAFHSLKEKPSPKPASTDSEAAGENKCSGGSEEPQDHE